MLTTTLGEIRSHDPCLGGWRDLLRSLDLDVFASKIDLKQEVSFTHILNTNNGIQDAIWAFHYCMPNHRHLMVHFAVDMAEQLIEISKDCSYHDKFKANLAMARAYALGDVSMQDYALYTQLQCSDINMQPSYTDKELAEISRACLLGDEMWHRPANAYYETLVLNFQFREGKAVADYITVDRVEINDELRLFADNRLKSIFNHGKYIPYE